MKKLCPKCGRVYDPTADACADDGARLVVDLRGQVLGGRYKLETLVGIGGMDSTVWRAWQTTTHRAVAVKVLPPAEEAAAARFARGGRIASNLNHPHITTVHDYGKTEDGQLYLVMEFLEGQTLSRLLKTSKNLPIDQALHITEQTLRALEHAHKQSVVHRDLKPANLFLVHHDDDPAFVKVLDFGIAKYVAEEVDDNDELDDVTKDHRLCGTPRYMAPEQIACSTVDARADIYALGVVLYRMLTGELPFEGRTSYELLTKHLSAPPRPFSETASHLNIPAELEAVVMKALAKAPDDRFQSSREMRQALRLVRHGMGVFSEDTEDSVLAVFGAAGPPTGTGPLLPDSTTDTAAEPSSKKRGWIPLAAAAAVLIGVLGWWIGTQPDDAGQVIDDTRAAQTVAAAEGEASKSGEGAEALDKGEAATGDDQPATEAAVAGDKAEPPKEEAAGEQGEPTPTEVGSPTNLGDAGEAKVETDKPTEMAEGTPSEVKPTEVGEPEETKPAEPEEPEATTVTVRLESKPEGAWVKLDGNSVGETPLTLQLQPGKVYQAVLWHKFYQYERQEIDLASVKAGETRDVVVELTKKKRRTHVARKKDTEPEPTEVTKVEEPAPAPVVEKKPDKKIRVKVLGGGTAEVKVGSKKSGTKKPKYSNLETSDKASKKKLNKSVKRLGE